MTDQTKPETCAPQIWCVVYRGRSVYCFTNTQVEAEHACAQCNKHPDNACAVLEYAPVANAPTPAPALDPSEVLPLVRAVGDLRNHCNNPAWLSYHTDDIAHLRNEARGLQRRAIDAWDALPDNWKRAAREGGDHE